jgi:hypothetical protein
MIGAISTNIQSAYQTVMIKASELRYIFNRSIQYLLCKLFKPLHCLRFFGTSFFNDFKQLLSTQLRDHPEFFTEELKEAAQGLALSKGSTSTRQAYERFTQALRDSFEADPNNPGLIELCKIIYKQDLIPSYKKLIETEFKIKNLDSVQALSAPDFHKFLANNYDRVLNSWSYNDNHGPDLYDPRMRGDLPSKVFDLSRSYFTAREGTAIEVKKKVEVVRTPNATLDTRVDGAWRSKVAPEFKGFLKNGQRHLYVNLMWSCQNNNEHKRSNALSALQPEFDNFKFVSLDKDTYFYHQIKQYASDTSANHFKTTFLDLMDAQDNFRFPDDIDVHAEFSTILNGVHAEFFQNKEHLTQQERKDFIELSYSAIIEYLSTKYNIDTMNVSCKSSVDRGASQMAMLHAYHNRHNKQSIDKKLITILTFAPSIGAKNRAMLKDRFVRMKSTLAHLL